MHEPGSIRLPGSPGGDPSQETVLCRACGRRIAPDDRFCRHCGRRQTTSDAWYYHPIAILVLAFLFVGPFALPLVFLSPRMGGKAKAAMASAITVYSLVVLYYTYRLIVLLIQLWSNVLQPFDAYQ